MVFGKLRFHNGSSLPSLLGYYSKLKMGCSIFADDHNIMSEEFEDYFSFLRDSYFPRVAWAPISLNPKKMKLFFDEIESLGFSLKDGCVCLALKH